MEEKEKKRPVGRPKVQLNHKQVELLAKRGWSLKEMASFFGCDPDTIADNFSVDIQKGKNILDGNLRAKQVRLAMKGNGNVPMLIWLGKQRLGQSEPKQVIQYEEKPSLFDNMGINEPK